VSSPGNPRAATHVRLVRHGEVAPQHHGTYYGCAEVPLSPAGLAASLTLAERLAAEPPTRVASSPLSRTLALAEPLARAAGAELVVVPDLRELDRGAWTHVSREEVERTSPGAVTRYLADPEEGNGPGGERESVFAARVWSALDALVADLPGGRLDVIAHGHVLRVVLRRLLGWDGPTSLTRQLPGYHAVVEARLRPDGTGEVLAAPDELRPPPPLPSREGRG
jgi:probable phosphoglycerate mutase